MTYITTRVSRDKLRLEDFDSDSVVVAESNTPEEISGREYNAAATELLALIWTEAVLNSSN